MAKPLEPCGLLELLRRSVVSKAGWLLAVESLQFCQRHPLDVAADAAFGEAQRHPGLEMREHAGCTAGWVAR